MAKTKESGEAPPKRRIKRKGRGTIGDQVRNLRTRPPELTGVQAAAACGFRAASRAGSPVTPEEISRAECGQLTNEGIKRVHDLLWEARDRGAHREILKLARTRGEAVRLRRIEIAKAAKFKESDKVAADRFFGLPPRFFEFAENGVPDALDYCEQALAEYEAKQSPGAPAVVERKLRGLVVQGTLFEQLDEQLAEQVSATVKTAAQVVGATGPVIGEHTVNGRRYMITVIPLGDA